MKTTVATRNSVWHLIRFNPLPPKLSPYLGYVYMNPFRMRVWFASQLPLSYLDSLHDKRVHPHPLTFECEPAA